MCGNESGLTSRSLLINTENISDVYGGGEIRLPLPSTKPDAMPMTMREPKLKLLAAKNTMSLPVLRQQVPTGLEPNTESLIKSLQHRLIQYQQIHKNDKEKIKKLQEALDNEKEKNKRLKRWVEQFKKKNV